MFSKEELLQIKTKALCEIKNEEFREAVEKMKVELKNKKSVWDTIFPYRIVFIKKGQNK